MDKELILLRKLHLNPKITQRDMAKATGLSLGSINLLIKRMVYMGIVKVEKMKNRTTMYSLTSLGIKQKAEGIYKYISEAYAFLRNLNDNIDELLENMNNNDYSIILFGKKDDICELIAMKLINKGTDYIVTNDVEKIKALSEKNEIIIIVWQPGSIRLLNDIKYKSIDLLNCI